MSTNKSTPGRGSAGLRWALLALVCGLAQTGLAQQTVYWRNGAGVSNWWDGANPWYRSGDGWWIARPDYNTLYESSTIGANIVRFDNGSDLTMSINGAYFQIHELMFDSGTGARTMTARDGGGIDMRSGSSTVKIENNDADAQVLNTPVVLYAATEINPVSGNLTLNQTVYLKDNWINVWGDNAKYLYLNGQLNADSGSGGVAVKQNSIVVMTNDNTFTGGIWAEKGTVLLATHTNAMGAGTLNVGTNATLDLQHGTVSLRPVALNLYNGQVTKTASASATITYKGNLASYNSSTVTVTDSTLYFGGDFAISSGTLTFTNSVDAGMASGSSLTGSGTLAKYGSGVFRLYPGTHSGNVSLNQGEIRQYTGTMTASGTLTMAGGTKYSSDGATDRTLTKALVLNGNVGLAVNSTGGLLINNTVGLGSGMRIVTNLNAVTIAGAVSSGGLAKTGAGTMVLTGTNTYALGTLVSAGVLEGTTSGLQGNVTNNSAVTFNQTANGTYAGVLSGTGALTNAGAGTVTLSGTSTLSGPTTVSAGTLLVSGAIGSSAVTVGSGATLAGAGTVGSIAGMSGGTVSPGNTAGTAGTLTVNGAAALGGGTYTCDLTGTGSTDCDKIAAAGAVAAGSALTINLPTSAPGGFSACTSYSWTIMSGSSASAANMAIGTKWSSSGTFGVSAVGNTIVVTHTPGAPGTPTVTASDGSSTAQVALSWGDVSCETGYVIYRNVVDTYASATALFTNAADTTTYNDTAATAGQLYYYWVTATNAGGNATSASDSGYKRLAAPGNVAATDGSSTANVTVTWDAVTGASTYHLYRDTDATPAGATALGPQSSGYADTSATPGQLYYYWVLASNSTSSSTSDWSTANSGYRKLATVTDVAATENLTDKVTVSWTDGAGETGYAIWRHTADVSNSATYVATAAADATSYDDVSAVAGTDYYYWVLATNSTSASQSGWSASDYGLRLLGEPSAAASDILFGDLDTTSYTVSWTRGSPEGDYVLVVAKQGGAPTDPTDTVVYAADATLGLGDTTAAGSYVVYKGTGTNVTVTGLSAGTEYTFAVYEFNGDATPNYRTSDEPTASRTTLVAEPTTQASTILVTTTNMASLYFNWANGNGSSRIVLMKAGGAVDGFPVDGSGYTNNATFGSGTQIGTGNYVVYSGSGTNVEVSSLANDTMYYIRVFEFNGSGLTANYLTSAAAGNPTNSTTMASVPDSNPTDLAVSAIGTNGFAVTWTKGTTGTNTLIVIRANGNPTDPTDLNTYAASATFGSGTDLGSGSYAVYAGTGSSVTVTNLAVGTAYTVEATSYNGAPGAENYRSSPTSTSASTLMPEPSQATAISFGTLAETSYAVSFTAGSGLSRLVVAKQGSAVDWTPTDGTAYSGENNDIGLAQEYGTGNFLVHRGASPFTLSGLTTETDYHIRIFEYRGTNATLNYNVSAASGNPSNRYTLSVEPTAHGTLSATALSDTEIQLDWTDATGESGYVIVRQAADSGWTAPVDGTAYTAGNSLGAGTVVYAGTAAGAGSYTNDSLSANTTNYYRIYPYAYDGTAAHGTHNYYVGGTPGSANATTGKAEPGTSSSVVSFLPASGTTATIAWTNTGTADGTIILVKSGSAVDADPADWGDYAADLAFGSGDEIGTGNFVVVAGAGKHGNATITGLSAGTTYHVAVYPYNGSGSFLNYRTTSPGTASVVILPDPSAASATADGKTLIDLAWTEDGYDVMIVYKSGSASTAPTQGDPYSVGSACGGGTVIFKGDGSALEHVVASGATHYYAFYSYSGNYYSAGLTDSDPTTSFASGEIVETFSYTNGTALTGLNGETGWGGSWYGDTTYFTNSNGSITGQTNYPAPTGNKVLVHPPDNTAYAVHRWLGQDYKNDKLYFSYMMKYTWNGPGKWEGLAFCYSNNEEKLFFGETGAADQYLGITNVYASKQLLAGSDYVVAGYYDWTAGVAKVNAYLVGSEGFPGDEPSSWDVTYSVASNVVGWVNTIRLVSGASAGTPGDTYFDEVRIATNWAGIVQVAPSKPDGDPTNQTATVDGNEMVRLAWTKNGAGNDVMIVHKTSAISTDPVDGTGYSAGGTIDGGTVVYKGSATALEHVVTPGTTNFYKFYSVNGANYYSTGVVANATNDAYASTERVNPFSYTNGIALGTTTIGGQGFGSGYWTVDSGTWTAATNQDPAVVDNSPKFLDLANYPDMQGNRVSTEITSDGGSAKAQRSLSAPVTTGTFYIAFQMAYQYRGSNKWAGISLLNSGGTEKAFFGKGGGGNWSTLGIGDGSTTYWSAFDLGQFYSSDGFGSTGNVYLVLGKYDFDTKLLSGKAYRILDTAEFPETEPSWDVSQTLGTGIDSIGRIQLNAGASAGSGYPGKVFFDEIRFATNWSGLLAVTCPTWVGSNTVNEVEWTAATNVWLGDYENFTFQSYPVSAGQSGGIEFDWAQDGSFATYHDLDWLKNENNNSYWSNTLQMATAGSITSRYVAAGGACPEKTTNNPALTVQNLNPPTDATATKDATYTNSQINLTWTRGTSGVDKDTLVVRQTVDAGWTTPVNGTTYNASDSLGSGTVVYRGPLEAYDDVGLAPSTTYYYRFYSENYTYYSVAYDEASAATDAGGQAIVIDGNDVDWVGSPATVLDSSASSLQEFIWTDKRGEMRPENGDHPNADLEEFRVFADDTWVYFLVKMTNVTDETKPFVAIGVDTRRDSGSTAENWLGDDSGTYIGSDYFGGGQAAVHYPEYQLNVHYVSAAGGARIEMYARDGTSWYAPPTSGNTNVAISAANDAVEFMVARADLNLAGATTGRFTVATFLNTGAWNNDADGTTQLMENTADAADAMSIPPWNVPDNSANLSAWLEDLSDADVDFWADVKFSAGGLTDNSKPATPVLVSPTNAAASLASPNLVWNGSTDADGEVTGYLLEISTNDQFNGVSGSENGTVSLRIHLDANTTNYAFTTSATQYWWRVRARDTAGELSAATTRWFRVVGKLDTEGPQPTLLYIGTNVAGYLAGDADITNRIAQYGPIQSVLDSEIRDTNNVFGFVLRWEDANGVYATNHAHADLGGGPGLGEFAFNIVDNDGRVSPNWDIAEYTNGVYSKDWDIDEPFYATNTLATGNADVDMTNYVHAAFSMTNYDSAVEYYLTVSAEDAYTDGGNWATYGSWPSYAASAVPPYYSGWCADGPNSARNVTTNQLILIEVRDDDIIAPQASTDLGWANDASLVVSNATGALAYQSGTGQDVLYEITDGALIGGWLSFSFNAYDAYYQGVALGTTETFADDGRTLTNTAFVAAYWQTNWANYDAGRSLVGDTTSGDTMVTWHWASITTQDVTSLWGPDSLDGDLGATNLIQLDLYDVDNDRNGDQASVRANFGRVRLRDDDSVDPVLSNETLQVTGTGLARQYVLTNLVTWPFTGSGGDRLTAAYAVVADDVVSGDFTNDTGAIQGTDIITVSAGFATGASRSWLFTLEPATTDKTFKAISLGFDSKVSSLNGPDAWELWGTMPGGSETLWGSGTIDLSDPENPVGTNWNSYSTAVAMPAATTGTVSFRLMAYVADTNHLTGTGTATWSVDSLIVSGYVLGPAGGTQITDQDLAHGTATFSLQAADVYSGIDGTIGSTGRAPRVDFWNESQSVVPVTNAFVTNGWSAATNATLSITGAAPAATDKRQIALGTGGASLTYYARFTVTDGDVDRDGDWRSVASVTTNTVYDEDSSKPSRGYLYGGPLGVYVDGALTKAVGSGNSREYRINDEQLQTASATSIVVKVNLYDYSGWTVPTLNFTNYLGSITTNGWLTANHTVDVDTTNQPDAAMEWQFGTNEAATLFNSYESVTNEFRVASVWDKDDDRLDAGSNNVDNLELTNARLGYVTFLDNDVGQANVQSNWSVSRDEWRVPQVFLGLPGDAARSNLYLSGLPASTDDGTVLADLTNRVYDSQLAKVSSAAPLSVVLPAFDTGGGGGGRTIKGVQRGTNLTENSTNGTAHTITNSSISIGSVAANNAANYRADLSSSVELTRIAAQFPTSVWTFAAFSYADVGTWLASEETVSNHVMAATLYDADDNRAGDQKVRTGVALGTLQVVDNDTVAPSLPAAVKANGVELSGPLTRDTAAWTNVPTFVVSFEPSVDGEPTGTDLEKTGIGEHRVATDKADVGPDTGTPLAVPAESSLANLGFESGSTNWTLSGAEISTEQAYEGTHSLKMTGSTAYQIVSLYNTNGYVPQVTVSSVQFMGAATGTVTVTGLDAAGDPVPGETFYVSIVGTAGVWNAGSSAPTDLDATVDRVQVTLTSIGNTYWDDVVVAIVLYDGATPVDEVSATFTATEQGLVTNYLFAVDRDNNRAGDRKASSAATDETIPAFGTAYDITPPTAVPDVEATTDEVGDPTTQFDVFWDPNKLNYEVGPDDPTDDNHPTKVSADRDILSPWRSYKIYYGTFDPNDVPPGDPGPGFADAYVYTNFVTNGYYLTTNWHSVTYTNAIADPSGAGTNYLALTNLSQGRIRLFDLDYDQEYALVVVGLDQAGNEGPATPDSWATNNTIKFAVTQGTLRAFAAAPTFPAAGGTNDFQPWTAPGQKAAALYWIAAGPTNAQGGYEQVTKDYDLIEYDAGSFQESSDWTWNLAGSVRTNWFVETNAFSLPRGTLRFYRASYKDRWRQTNVVTGLPQRPLASEEVYALHNIVISEGRNHVGLQGEPYTNTFAGVFGTDTNVWPAGSSAAAGATKVEFYTPGTNAPVSDVYFFATDANWYKVSPLTKVTTNLQAAGFFTRGFSITLPTNLTGRGYATSTNSAWTDYTKTSAVPSMVWHPILKVPTNGFTHVVACGEQNTTVTNVMYNVLSLDLPVAAHPSQLNLPTNFTKGTFRNADMIYTLDTLTKDVPSTGLIYCRAADSNWYFTTGGGVPAGYFKPNDVIVIVSRNGGLGNSWEWTYHPSNFYVLPTRWMGQ